MISETMRYATIKSVAGIGIPVLTGLNSALGGGWVIRRWRLYRRLWFFLTDAYGFGNIETAPPHLFLVAFYVLSITWIAPKFGVGNAVFFVSVGQLISAALIDYFGPLGVRITPLTLAQTSGIAHAVYLIYLEYPYPNRSG